MTDKGGTTMTNATRTDAEGRIISDHLTMVVSKTSDDGLNYIRPMDAPDWGSVCIVARINGLQGGITMTDEEALLLADGIRAAIANRA